MATATLPATANRDGYIYAQSTTAFMQIRDSTAGTAYNSDSFHTQAVQSQKFSARGSEWRIKRAFFYFDTSSYTTVTSATINIRSHSSLNSGDIIGVKATASDPLSGADFDAIDGWTGATDTDQSSNVTVYVNEVETWNNSSFHNMTLTSDAISDINNTSGLNICFLNADYDLIGQDPGTATDVANSMYFTDNAGTSSDPSITITYTEATDNAVFFGTNF